MSNFNENAVPSSRNLGRELIWVGILSSLLLMSMI
jgi:hypothetical protein